MKADRLHDLRAEKRLEYRRANFVVLRIFGILHIRGEFHDEMTDIMRQRRDNIMRLGVGRFRLQRGLQHVLQNRKAQAVVFPVAIVIEDACDDRYEIQFDHKIATDYR